MYIHRTLENQILPFLDRREAISIVGPRQAGKTTFIEFLGKVMEEKGKKVKFLTFELTFQTGKYMVGRLLEFALSPFSFREFLS